MDIEPKWKFLCFLIVVLTMSYSVSEAASQDEKCTGLWAPFVDKVASHGAFSERPEGKIVLFAEVDGNLHDCLGLDVPSNVMLELQHDLKMFNLVFRKKGAPGFRADFECWASMQTSEYWNLDVLILRMPERKNHFTTKQCTGFLGTTLPQTLSIYFD